MISRWLLTLIRNALSPDDPRAVSSRALLRLEGLENREVLSTVSVTAPAWWSPGDQSGTIETRTVYTDLTDDLPDEFRVQFGPLGHVQILNPSFSFGSIQALPVIPATPPSVAPPNSPDVPPSAPALPNYPPSTLDGQIPPPPAPSQPPPPPASNWVVVFGDARAVSMTVDRVQESYQQIAPAPAVTRPEPVTTTAPAIPPADPQPTPAPTPVVVARGVPAPPTAPATPAAPTTPPAAGAVTVRTEPTAPRAETPTAPPAASPPTAPTTPVAVAPPGADASRAASPAVVQAARTDGELLRRFAAAGDQSAFTELVRRYGPAVQATATRVLGDADRARDAAQATFLALARRAHALDDRGSLAGWLHQVARRMALRVRSTVARHRRVERVAAEMYEEPDDTLSAVEDQDLVWALREELARLPEKYRVPLSMCYLDGQTHAEVARAVGMPRGSVAKRIGEGLARLRENLAGRGIGA